MTYWYQIDNKLGTSDVYSSVLMMTGQTEWLSNDDDDDDDELRERSNNGAEYCWTG